MILLIDNFDSFTYNIAQYLQELGEEVSVVRNNVVSVDLIKKKQPYCLMFSPGPGRPAQAGRMMEILHAYKGKIPMLGVCLGHQAIGEAFGMVLSNAKYIMHGKLSEVTHDGKGVFQGLPEKIKVVRYHSLALEEKTLPDDLLITAKSDDGEIMGIRHKSFMIEGIQYHPESILTTTGKRQLSNFVHMAKSA